MNLTISNYHNSAQPNTVVNFKVFYELNKDTNQYSINPIDILASHIWNKITPYPHTEREVASKLHPTYGSIGTDYFIADGRTISYQVIFYYDYNPRLSHFPYSPHFNVELRIISGENSILFNKISCHALADSASIRIDFEGWTFWLFRPIPQLP